MARVIGMPISIASAKAVSAILCCSCTGITASFMASIHLAEDGLPPSEQDARGILWRALARMRSLGVADDLWVAPEYEFHVLDDVEIECTPVACGYRVLERPVRPGTGYHRAWPDDHPAGPEPILF